MTRKAGTALFPARRARFHALEFPLQSCGYVNLTGEVFALDLGVHAQAVGGLPVNARAPYATLWAESPQLKAMDRQGGNPILNFSAVKVIFELSTLSKLE